ncbi:hypothetical protein AYO21_09418 [Fonsecaea monophora]|uniref:Nucleotidyltransferase n=1 Tax=Fonsecaea monophora TaxID=254056 RepID=A0A177EWL3_9EURO|nr:hypothetical protein AYO21_09418 [Fonsecaea monophora]KAH0834437.1 hypothetical protein FOPE_03770 [Fonsecaea pedrosoi]OAG36433.1 hypothetical protein AYO21_09418 [Fonsecaea monophora]
MTKEMRIYQAAVDLDKVLTENGIGYGCFGGWAINAIGCDRGTKDIDCLVGAEKDDIARVFSDQPGWHQIPGQREDYIAFLVGEKTENVLVEMFPCKPGFSKVVPMSLIKEATTKASVGTEAIKSMMQSIATRTVPVRGYSMRVLEIVYIFKGKVNAAANRSKVSDSNDIEYVHAHFESTLREHVHQINIQDVGKAIKRYPSLSKVFSNLGIDVKEAVEQAGSLEITSMHPPPFLCQKAMLE